MHVPSRTARGTMRMGLVLGLATLAQAQDVGDVPMGEIGDPQAGFEYAHAVCAREAAGFIRHLIGTQQRRAAQAGGLNEEGIVAAARDVIEEPASPRASGNERLTGLALRVERVEILVMCSGYVADCLE
jgi:hypothetical protein